MKPRMSQIDDPQQVLYRIELLSIIDTAHPLVKLAAQFNWQAFDQLFGLLYDGQMGAPAKSTRLMVGLHYLKHSCVSPRLRPCACPERCGWTGCTSHWGGEIEGRRDVADLFCLKKLEMRRKRLTLLFFDIRNFDNVEIWRRSATGSIMFS